MDKRWKALTAPLWAELRTWRYVDSCMYEKLPRDIARECNAHIILKLLEIRRARLAGECPVMWKLSQP